MLSEVISPKLFPAFLEEISKSMKRDKIEMKIDDERFNNLIFADDIVLLSESEENTPKITEELNKVFKSEFEDHVEKPK